MSDGATEVDADLTENALSFGMLKKAEIHVRKRKKSPILRF
jgi:hypothetical protein